MQPREQLAGPRAHLGFAQPPETAGQLAAGKDVRRHRQIRERQHLLMHEPDPARQRIARTPERHGLVADAQFAAIGLEAPRQDLQQRRLACAVLADDGVGFGVGDGKGHIAERGDRAERFVDLPKLDRRHGYPLNRCGARPDGPGRQRKMPPACGWLARSAAVNFTAAVVT